jgi:hypothetical protein
MKWYSRILKAFCVCALIFLSAAIGLSDDGQLYRNNQYFFSIVMPGGWTIQKGRNPHVVVKAYDSSRSASVAVTVQALSATESSRDITETLKPMDIVRVFIGQGADAALIDGGTTTLWNEKAVWAKYYLSISHLGMTAHTINYQVAAFHRGYMYSLQVGGGADNKAGASRAFNSNEPQLSRALASFAFEDWRRTK